MHQDVAPLLRRSAGAPLFMVVDAARDEMILPRLAALEGQVPLDCLWQGESADEHADVAPYLVALPDDGAADRLAADGWGRAWGIFVSSLLSPGALRRHLRRFTMVRLPDGEAAFFRFYDPRVLRPFLPTCDAEQTGRLFDGVACFLAETADGGAVLRHTFEKGQLTVTEIPLEGPGRLAGPRGGDHTAVIPWT